MILLIDLLIEMIFSIKAKLILKRFYSFFVSPVFFIVSYCVIVKVHIHATLFV